MSNVHPFPASGKATARRNHGCTAPAYAELAVTTNFSFLRGGSHPEELVEHATSWAWPASALPTATRWPASCARIPPPKRTSDDVNERKLKIALGARLVFADGTPDILAYPQDRAAWGRLTRLLTVGKSRGDKAECILYRRRSAGAHRRPQSHCPACRTDRCRCARRSCWPCLKRPAPTISLAGREHALSRRRRAAGWRG